MQLARLQDARRLDKGYDFPELYELAAEFGVTAHVRARARRRRRSGARPASSPPDTNRAVASGLWLGSSPPQGTHTPSCCPCRA